MEFREKEHSQNTDKMIERLTSFIKSNDINISVKISKRGNIEFYFNNNLDDDNIKNIATEIVKDGREILKMILDYYIDIIVPRLEYIKDIEIIDGFNITFVSKRGK